MGFRVYGVFTVWVRVQEFRVFRVKAECVNHNALSPKTQSLNPLNPNP